MPLFRLLPNVGTHNTDGNIAEKGSVVESDLDLVAKFKNKFERVVENVEPRQSVAKRMKSGFVEKETDKVSDNDNA